MLLGVVVQSTFPAHCLAPGPAPRPHTPAGTLASQPSPWASARDKCAVWSPQGNFSRFVIFKKSFLLSCFSSVSSFTSLLQRKPNRYGKVSTWRWRQESMINPEAVTQGSESDSVPFRLKGTGLEKVPTSVRKAVVVFILSTHNPFLFHGLKKFFFLSPVYFPFPSYGITPYTEFPSMAYTCCSRPGFCHAWWTDPENSSRGPVIPLTVVGGGENLFSGIILESNRLGFLPP